jgi:hypothetical protein
MRTLKRVARLKARQRISARGAARAIVAVSKVNRPPSPLSMLRSRHTRRREFIAGIGSAAAVLPRAAVPSA